MSKRLGPLHDWTPPPPRGRFHPPTVERIHVSSDAVDDTPLYIVDLYDSEGECAKVIEEVMSTWGDLWGHEIVFRGYRFADRSQGRHRLTAADVVALLWELGDQRSLPQEISGCSVKYLELGNIWEETVESLADSVYFALAEGGPYSDPLDEERASELARRYVACLADQGQIESLRIFGLDRGFSCWFYGVHWDIAYAVVDQSREILSLLLATSTD